MKGGKNHELNVSQLRRTSTQRGDLVTKYLNIVQIMSESEILC